MSLELAAQHLASRGRGPDTTLVHMAPQEVAGLQALAKAAGGTLTTNPDTGLPEAGFLKNLLPTLIGVGLTAATGGAAAPWMIGLGLGGLETMRTGSLEKGLMAGLGAYGGAGLAGGLMGAGAGAAQQAAMAGAGEGASQAAMNQAAAEATKQALVSPMSTMGAGIQGLGTEAGRSAALSSMGGGLNAARYGLAAASPMMSATQDFGPYQDGKPNYEYTYDPDTMKYTRVPVGTRDGSPQTYTPAPSDPGQLMRNFFTGKRGATDTVMDLYEYRNNALGMAAGGPVQEMSQRNVDLTLMANGGQMFAAGGVSHLGDYSDGGRLLKGPGDGVSDSIPATIADKRPARLADGEFVVPARIVSELGNGSTEAGARKLYAMMDRIQKARGKTVGKDRVAVNSRADKALPA